MHGMARRSYTITDEQRGLRLDQALAALVPGLSRRGARSLIESGAVYLEGRRCRTASKFVRSGASITLETLAPPLAVTLPKIKVLWAEQGLLALDKTAGVPFSPTRSTVEGTLLYALARNLGRPIQQLHPVHRLDTPTSGAVLVALTAEAAAFMGRALEGGHLRKTYLALVSGCPAPGEGEWGWPLTEVGGDGRVHTDPAGRPATSLYRTLRLLGEGSLLELHPVTGRTHQLRAHCALAGCPIVGDKTYGGPLTAPRALLHAWRLAFPLPEGGEQVVEAPIPPDMER